MKRQEGHEETRKEDKDERKRNKYIRFQKFINLSDGTSMSLEALLPVLGYNSG